MTLQEFIEANPNDYGAGRAHLLYSSSVSGSARTPIPPYFIEGVSLPFNSKNLVYIEPVLRTVNQFNFTYPSGSIESKVIGRQKRSGYYYFSVTPFSSNQLPVGVTGAGNPKEDDSEFVFTPYSATGFTNSNYNPLINNSEGSKLSPVTRVVDRNADAANPTNMQAIINFSATFAESQECSYTKTGILNSKYNGSKTTPAGPIAREYNKQLLTNRVNSTSIPGNDPAINLVTFQGSLHADDADTTTIKAILNADREIEDILFNPILSGSHPNKTFPSFPKSGSFIFGVTGGRTFKLANQKIYSIDTAEVFTTNNLGGITIVE